MHIPNHTGRHDMLDEVRQRGRGTPPHGGRNAGRRLGVVVGIGLSVAVVGVALAVRLSSDADDSSGSVGVGDCVSRPDPGAAALETVSCDAPHEYEVVVADVVATVTGEVLGQAECEASIDPAVRSALRLAGAELTWVTITDPAATEVGRSPRFYCYAQTAERTGSFVADAGG